MLEGCYRVPISEKIKKSEKWLIYILVAYFSRNIRLEVKIWQHLHCVAKKSRRIPMAWFTWTEKPQIWNSGRTVPNTLISMGTSNLTSEAKALKMRCISEVSFLEADATKTKKSQRFRWAFAMLLFLRKIWFTMNI